VGFVIQFDLTVCDWRNFKSSYRMKLMDNHSKEVRGLRVQYLFLLWKIQNNTKGGRSRIWFYCSVQIRNLEHNMSYSADRCSTVVKVLC